VEIALIQYYKKAQRLRLRSMMFGCCLLLTGDTNEGIKTVPHNGDMTLNLSLGMETVARWLGHDDVVVVASRFQLVIAAG
jgi:hypothetical protein